MCLWAQSSVWDGVYTNEQAARGQTAYGQNCESCHGEKLDGGGQAPPLAGDEFLNSWNHTTLAELFERIQTDMPADKPNSLSKDTNADILAYILKTNKFPAGEKPIAAGDALKNIRIEAQRKQ
ncbi:MAG TPA: cytochrome c [Bryobacteraceae bacterium]|nr:cytochrome c [Bryobacteraceae bacterium]